MQRRATARGPPAQGPPARGPPARSREGRRREIASQPTGTPSASRARSGGGTLLLRRRRRRRRRLLLPLLPPPPPPPLSPLLLPLRLLCTRRRRARRPGMAGASPSTLPRPAPSRRPTATPSGGAGSSAACTPARRLYSYPATCVAVGPQYAKPPAWLFVGAFLLRLPRRFSTHFACLIHIPLSPTPRATAPRYSTSVPRHLCR